MSTQQQPIFIVSTGRCGSTMLSRMLALHPEVASFSEFFTSLFPYTFSRDPCDGPNFWHMLSAPRLNHKLWIRLMDRGIAIDEFRYPLSRLDRYREAGIPPLLAMALPELTSDPEALHEELRVYAEGLPMANLRTHYLHVFEWLARRLNRRIWVERSGSSLGFLEPIVHLFPDAKFVHIYREGPEMALSASKFPPMRLAMISRDFQAAVRKTLYERIPPRDVPRLPKEYHPLLAPHFDIDAYLRLSIPIERFAMTWSNMICRLPLLTTLPPGRVMHLRYESILADPEPELRRFLEFLDPGLEQDEWLKRAIPLLRPNPPKWTKLPAEERARLEAACAPGVEMLKRLGL